ncbi:hypothetical protein L5515_017658 [Caenorhabditis briggsae]|uniref:Uncharacterized protein n=1 Tax=Caenorhabditis briggsae TaxID=6238 RepID=A0AAE9JRL9_CAEBR|nr:hypothetical protein L3Y34_011786 [Caenorhabditis briggsae]UMM41372.1 hypothetical protein L5515_017658 [Caenorhabditis briggsae]
MLLLILLQIVLLVWFTTWNSVLSVMTGIMIGIQLGRMIARVFIVELERAQQADLGWMAVDDQIDLFLYMVIRIFQIYIGIVGLALPDVL